MPMKPDYYLLAPDRNTSQGSESGPIPDLGISHLLHASVLQTAQTVSTVAAMLLAGGMRTHPT
jgi:hypothetical protein